MRVDRKTAYEFADYIIGKDIRPETAGKILGLFNQGFRPDHYSTILSRRHGHTVCFGRLRFWRRRKVAENNV